tara:strand:- start:45 stop:800 length:756 start_codon:yes stop_codon:yes gene_type:complete
MNTKKYVDYKQNINKKFNRDNLVLVSKILNHDEYFVFYGTLLGLSREKDIIENDDDIDLLVDIKNRDNVVEKIEKSILQIDYSNPYNKSPYFLQAFNETKNIKSYIDFYFYENYKNLDYIVERCNFFQNWNNPSQSLHIPKKIIFPIKNEYFFNTIISLPKKHLNVCKYLYGKKWKVPQRKNKDYKIIINNNVPEFHIIKNININNLSDGDRNIASKIQHIENDIQVQSNKLNALNKEKHKLFKYLTDKTG